MRRCLPLLPLLFCVTLWWLFFLRLPVQATPMRAPAFDSLAFDCGAVTEIPSEECKALVALYTAGNGANWRNQTGWLITATPCQWVGVLCENGHVVELRLANNNLAGAIPTNFGYLPWLRVLDLNDNDITSLPAKVGDMVQLQVLALRGNQFITITSKIGKLSQLVELDLSGNGLTAFPGEASNLLNLVKLHLNHNALPKLPAEIGNLIKLQELNLSVNGLSAIPGEVGTLTKLLALRLDYNRLTTLPAEISHLHKLQILTLNNNALTALPLEVAKLNDLRFFTLSNNLGLTGPLPDGWRAMTQLTTFWFDNTNFCEPQMPPFQQWLQTIPNLKRSGLACLYTYTAAFTVTTPGDLFTLLGTDFSAARPLPLLVNGVNVGLLQSNSEGSFAVVLDTRNLPVGAHLALITDGSDQAQLLIQPGAQSGAPVITLPANALWAAQVYLPVVQVR